jgi:hypothetical protein
MTLRPTTTRSRPSRGWSVLRVGPHGDPGTFVYSDIGPHLLSAVLPIKAVSRKVRLQKLLAPLHPPANLLCSTRLRA